MRIARYVLAAVILTCLVLLARCGGGGPPPAGGITLVGEVVSAADAVTPVPNAYVYVPWARLAGKQETDSVSDTTDESGQFELRGLPREAISLTVDLPPQSGYQGIAIGWDLSAWPEGATVPISIKLLPLDVQVERLYVRPSEPDLLIGETLQFLAMDEAGQAHYSPTWIVEGNIGTITKSGLFTAQRLGQGMVKAVSGNKKAGTTVFVVAQLPPPENQPPTATLSAAPTEGAAPLQVTFNGSATDPDGQVVEYLLSFGDGLSRGLTGPPSGLTYTYDSPNVYTATLKVRDDKGSTGTASVQITVTNELPAAVASASPTSGFVPLTVQFSSQGSSDPDGQIVAYQWTFGDNSPASSEANPSHTYQTPGQYTAVLRVTDNAGAVSNAGVQVEAAFWRIAFESYRDGAYEIFAMDSDGSNMVNLTNDPSGDFCPAWSPDGSRIAFATTREGSYEVYVMNAHGSNPVRLTDGGPATKAYPAWSPDGTRIAFGSTKDGDYEIYVMDADGSNVVKLTDNTAKDPVPSWSPDGTRIAFHSDRDGDAEIYVMNRDGSNQVKLTNNLALDKWPAWSRDGTKIAFYSERDGNSEIYVMNPDGTAQVNLTNSPAADRWPAWSPDSGKIAFTSYRDGNYEIYVMNADGSNPVRLTSNSVTDRCPGCSPGLVP